MPQMAGPIRRRDFIFDQRIDGVGIRNAQQRLGQTHQRDAFVGGQAVFGQKHLHQTGARVVADGAHQNGGLGADHVAIRGGQICTGLQIGDLLGFIGIGAMLNCVAQGM